MNSSILANKIAFVQQLQVKQKGHFSNIIKLFVFSSWMLMAHFKNKFGSVHFYTQRLKN